MIMAVIWIPCCSDFILWYIYLVLCSLFVCDPLMSEGIVLDVCLAPHQLEVFVNQWAHMGN